jgi:hypothetical protein
MYNKCVDLHVVVDLKMQAGLGWDWAMNVNVNAKF